ncbi:MAG: HD domain-containing protein [Lachnospiraceae bacterium]|nr:HD domain-containing protein [Lachnospiraceae bacterium]
MNAPDISTVAGARRSNKRAIFICAAGIIINIAGSYLAGFLKLPLYLDSIGTVISAALGGILPGIITGLVTNALKVISDPTSVYYGVLNVLIAVITAEFVKRSLLKKLRGALLLIVTLALVGGGLGSVLTWFLYGFAGEGITIPFVQKLYDTGAMGMFPAQLAGDFLIDLADKALTVVVLITVIHLIPDSIRGRFQFEGWQQAPLTEKSRDDFKNTRCRSVSLRTKILLLITISLMAISIASVWISYVVYMKASIEQHTKLGKGIATLTASVIDPDKVDDFINNGDRALGYTGVEQLLYDIRESSPNIEYVYVYRIEGDGCRVVFDLDTDELAGEAPGTLVPFDESFSEYLPDLLAGRRIDPIVTDDTYGWLLTVYEPVYNRHGDCVCYACADVSMEQLKTNAHSFLAKQISLFLGFFFLILSVGVWLAEYNIILPLNTMAGSAGEFEAGADSSFEGGLAKIKELDISTGDEIENLYHSLLSMSEDCVWYMDDIKHKTENMQKMQNGLIMVLADMVESRDANTGQHVRKTAAYTWIIMDELREEGLHTDILTDEYIYAVVNSAPLHDIGKINVPDAILNKPGKLTDEEYAIMKTHATAGRDIITKTMETLPDSGYLKEARDLAAYHHEKWDGNGYPEGLKGEEIPLSARIMAVADVFDALVSKRSYKKSFTIEKAFDIIREGMGTHFDPQVAQAFLNAEERVRDVAEMYDMKDQES